MRIGILTHHYVKNYGAFLQMKALYEVLKEVYPGAEIEIIHYVNKKHWTKNIIHILHFRRGIDTFGTYCSKIKQLFVFSKYEHIFRRTKRVRDAKELMALDLDLFFFGSDEIWSIAGSGYYPMKFGYGLEKIKDRLIAYAPSAGSVTSQTEIPAEVKEGLNSFGKLSARDKETQDFIKRASGRDGVRMLDPTFLYNFDQDIEREQIAPKKDDYILIYDCKLTSGMAEELVQYARANHLKIIGAGDYKKFYDEVTISLTPYEWVSLFRDAKKVVTGTFHGTVFSLKYDKDVVAYPTELNRINKISSLLHDMGQDDRLLKVGNEGAFIERLNSVADYEYTHNYIATKQKEAKDFLKV